jgi:class 3 adenylate cyclase
MVPPLVAGAAAIGVILYAQSRRWFGRFDRGFLLAIAFAIGSVGLLATALVGTLGYAAARNIWESQLSTALESAGDIVQHQVDLEVERATDRMTGLSRDAARALSPGGDLADFASSLRAVQSFNPHYLEIDAIDATARIVASSHSLEGRPPPDRIATAFNLEGRNFVSEPRRSAAYNRVTLYISVPVKNATGGVMGALGTTFDLQSVFEEVVDSARFSDTGYMWIVGGDGHVLAHPEKEHVGQDVATHAVVVAGQSAESGEMDAKNLDNIQRHYFFRRLRNPQTIDPKPWLLLTAIDAREAFRPLAPMLDELIVAAVTVILATVIVAWRVSVSLTRPMDRMVDVAQAIRSGDLTRRTGLHGRDAIGRLGSAMDEMTKGLEERDHVKDVFGKYIAKQAAEYLLKGPLDLGGQAKHVTILFSDIRGFTTMAETMTPEQVVGFLNDYFSEMVDAVMETGGVLDKYLGDGMMAVFGSFGDQPDHARRAVLASLRMKALLAKINGERAVAGKPPISIGIGIHSADVIVGNIGSKKRLEYTHIGDGVNVASRVQTLNKEYGTTILITGATFAALGDEFQTRSVGEVTLRGKRQPLPIYEVVSSAAAAGQP